MFAKRSITRLLFTSFMLISLFFSGLGVTPASAAGITVNTNVDEITTNGLCSLREAIINANNNAATYPDCATAFGTDIITFAGNYTITLAGAELPAVTSTIIINGNGAANTIIQANASPNTATYRVFTVSGSNGNMTLDSLTVRHGRCTGTCNDPGSKGGGIYKDINSSLTVTNSTISGNTANFGGGIYNDIDGGLILTNSIISGNTATSGGGIFTNYSPLTIINSTIQGNTAGSDGGSIYIYTSTSTVTNSILSGNSTSNVGGGIFNYGSLTITNSTLSGNSAGSNGGGIYNSSGRNLAVTSSTLSGNKAAMGGGIYNDGDLVLANTTLSGNEAYDYGGGIYSDGSAAIANSTIVFNTLVEGTILGAGGIDGNVSLFNSIVAGNTRLLTSEYRDCSGTMYLVGVNAFWNMTNCSSDPASPGYSTELFSLNELGPLQNNGGPTWTHALIPIEEGSRAIDAGDNTVCANSPINNLDQRGVTRPQGSRCDVGAYEAVPTFISTAAQDGWILESSETSGRGGSKNATASTIHLGDNATNKQYRGILSFDTSAIPEDAIIHKVTLKVKKAGVKGGGNPVRLFRGFMIDVKTGNFGVATLQLGDFKVAGSRTLGPVKPPLVNGWYNLDLTAASLQINTTGNTQIRLRFKLDDNNNLVANYLSLYSGNAALTNQPLLIVEYTVP